MPEVDIEERKLQYLNRSANVQSDDEQKKLDKDYADVLRHMSGDKPARGPVFPPSGEAIPLTIENLIGAFGAKAVAQEALDQLTEEERDEIFPALDLTQTVDDRTAFDIVSETLPKLTLDELNQVLDALGPLIDNGGAEPDAGNGGPPVTELAPGFPIAWRELQWKKKVALANSLGATVANATEADAFLTERETKLKGA